MKYNNKKILITGGTSFLAQHLVKHFIDNGCKYIRLSSRDEVKQSKMKAKFNDDRLHFIISDVRDSKSTEYSMHDIDIVIHTAALKRVDSAEYNVFEFLKTNTKGAMNIVNCAIKNNVDKVIGISTDKACMPITLYGASKFAAEKIFTHGNVYSGSGRTKFACVRYGNVFCSTGSLIHIFKSQYVNNQPLTVTHPDMTRFFMEVNESVKLVEHAINNMKGNGEVFVPKQPSFKILDLAKAIGGNDYPIKYIGLRGIEKMHETLVSKEEMLSTIEDDKYFTILPTKPVREAGWVYPKVRWNDCYNYSSNTNKEWLGVDNLKLRIR